MARKNPFASVLNDDVKARNTEPMRDYVMQGASRSILTSIDEIASRANMLVEGETVIELHPAVVDSSFVRDRLDTDDEEFRALLNVIRDRGQDSPVLVRPHPTTAGRYMIVFGHRRLRAAQMLGRKLRAVVKEMKDEEHVLVQGQENSARANLSFIEKALFAANLDRLRYDSDNVIILKALTIDRTTLSKMLSVASLPEKILHAIGSAKGIGRDRWYELKLLLEKPSHQEIALRVVAEDSFSALSSDERFNTLLAYVKAAKTPSRMHVEKRKRNWSPEDGSLAAEMTLEGKRFTLNLKAKGADAKAFGEYLSDNLDMIYKAFRENTDSTRY